MASPALALAAVLLFAPPAGERPPVQSPSVAPTQPQPGDPAIAPAHVEGVAATPDAAPAEQPAPDPALAPEPEPEPMPTGEPSTGELPSWQTDVPPPQVDAGDMPQPTDDWGMPVEPPPKKYPPKGGGFYAGAGALFGVMITRQWITALICDDVYCGWRGNFDRLLGLGVMGFAAGGGWFDGRRSAAIAYDEGKPAVVPKGRRAAGWTLFALGLGGMLTDTVLYNLCYQQAKGPYTKISGFSYTCSPVASVVIVDFSTLFGAVGLGLGMSAESRIRHRKKLDMTLAPYGGRDQAGLSLTGRF